MSSVKLAPRSSNASPLRCAFCHDDAAERLRSCASCGALLHVECWELAGSCPSLGCVPSRPSPAVVEEPWHGLERRHVAAWLGTLALGWFFLFGIVPWFEAAFAETGLNVPESTQLVVSASHRSADPYFVLLVAVEVGLSLAILGRARRSAWARRACVALTGTAWVLLVIALLALLWGPWHEAILGQPL